MDQELPTQLLSAVPHFTFSIFNVAIPNLIAWSLLVVVFVAALWSRLPRFLERPEAEGRAAEQQDHEQDEGGPR